MSEKNFFLRLEKRIVETRGNGQIPYNKAKIMTDRYRERWNVFKSIDRVGRHKPYRFLQVSLKGNPGRRHSKLLPFRHLSETTAASRMNNEHEGHGYHVIFFSARV